MLLLPLLLRRWLRRQRGRGICIATFVTVTTATSGSARFALPAASTTANGAAVVPLAVLVALRLLLPIGTVLLPLLLPTVAMVATVAGGVIGL